jgi:hypothetical protein
MKNLLLIILAILIISCNEDNPTENNTPETQYCTDIADMPEGLANTYVRIVALLPNPKGDDDYNEKFEIRSFKDSIVDFSSYYILDDENVRWDLSKLNFEVVQNGQSENCKSLIYTSDKIAELLNGGDIVYLYDSKDRLLQTFEYNSSKDGEWVYP